MKGIVFTEFLEMVEADFGPDMMEDIIDSSELESGGAYTSVGTYPDSEMIQLLTQLSEKSGVSTSVLLNKFGHAMLRSFAKKYSHWISDCGHGFDLLMKVDNYIHIEVKKLYPEAFLPKFNHERIDEHTLIYKYSSPRKMGDLAEGLIEGTMEAFGHQYTIDRKNITEDGSAVEFTIKVL